MLYSLKNFPRLQTTNKFDKIRIVKEIRYNIDFYFIAIIQNLNNTKCLQKQIESYKMLIIRGYIKKKQHN